MKRFCTPTSSVGTTARCLRRRGLHALAGRTLALLLFLLTAVGGRAADITLTTGIKGTTTYTSGVVTATFPDGSASSNGYIKFSKGQTFSVTASSGTITKIVLNYATDKTSKPENIQAGTGSISSDETAKTGTWTGSGTSITFTNNASNAADVYIASLVVTLGDGEDGDTPTLPTAASTFKVANTTYTANQSLWNDAKTARVVLGGWLFPNKITPASGATTDEFGGTGSWGSVSQPNKKKEDYAEDYDYLIEEGNNKNARQEDGSNAQPLSTSVYKNEDGKMVEVLTTVDPMFNVPCNGSYLVFTAVSPGTIYAVIRQNGVFDDTNSKNQYRPQRRVFVLDEAGNIVPSTPQLLNEGGKLPSTTLSDYTWDYGTMPTTEAEVEAHFVNLSGFSMSNFKNGVYESNLTYDVCKNEALKDEALKDVTGKGYRGWSVLSDGPVGYTFDVLPGKTYYLYNFGSRIGFYGFTFTPKANVTVDAVTYKADEETPAIEQTAEGHTATVALERTFKGGVWNAAVLPFSLNKQQVDALFGETYSSSAPEGTQILYFDHTEGSTIYFVRHAYNTIVAGKPFLIKPAKEGDFTLNTADITSDGAYRYVTIEKTEAEDFGRDKAAADYCWHAAFGKQTVAAGDYFLRDFQANGKAADGKVVRVPVTYAGTFTIEGFRGYLKAKDETTRKNAKSMTIGISSFDSDETTYIENVTLDADGTLRPALNGKVYNLQGQVVRGSASDLDGLAKGIYIVNGKKVSIK